MYPSREKARKLIQLALKNWGNVNNESKGLLKEFYLTRTHIKNKKHEIYDRLITNHILMSCVEEMAEIDSSNSEIIIARFIKGESILKISHDLNLSQDQINRRQREGINKISDIFYNKDYELRKTKLNQINSSIQINNNIEIYGFDDYKKTIYEKIVGNGMPNVLVISGLGGIGKTTLAGLVTQDVISTWVYDEIIWVRLNLSIDQEIIVENSSTWELIIIEINKKLFNQSLLEKESESLIRTYLIEYPALIILDNIESNVDISEIAEKLSKLAGNSKIIVTSRNRPKYSENYYCLHLDEISFATSLKILTSYAEFLDLNYPIEKLNKIFEKMIGSVGGNPLALKLVVGLLGFLTIDQILEGLISININEIEQLYKNIYWKVWKTLNDKEKSFLQMMTLVSERGGTLDLLQEMSEIEDQKITQIARNLYRRSLVEIRGDMDQPRYGIHRLTKSFLLSEIIGWPF